MFSFQRFVCHPSTRDTIRRCVAWSLNPQSLLVLPALSTETLFPHKACHKVAPSPTESVISLPSARFMFPPGSIFGSPKGPPYEQLAEAQDQKTLEKSAIFAENLVLEKDK